jgi:putative (di)nucleoside polyphosphate hydrolase
MTVTLPYRRSAGVMLVNRAGAAFIGRRKKTRESGVLVGHEWQMPQGGLDDGEEPLEAALRELYEETNVSSTALLAEAPQWLNYDLPDQTSRWRGRYRGQTQKWFLLRFLGEETEIDVDRPAGGAHPPEFDAWRWERLEALPALVVPFKRKVYEDVVTLFAPLAVPARG